MTDFLDEKRKEIDTRLRELRPLVDEYQRLEQAAAALAGVTKPGSRSHHAGARAPPPAQHGGKRGRPRGSGKRAIQAHELVTRATGNHDPRAGRRDEDPDQLPLQGDADAAGGGEGSQGG